MNRVQKTDRSLTIPAKDLGVHGRGRAAADRRTGRQPSPRPTNGWTLASMASALEVSAKPRDRALAALIRRHWNPIQHWLTDASVRRSEAVREELLQVAIVACLELLAKPDPEEHINEIRSALDRHAYGERKRERREASLQSVTEGERFG